ncbi:amidohydrolase [Lewinella sp. W8]|uniref:amidohydrolase n=1 Tax=Lewinella sp. W8 TaxID=2528208 RepID=UPI001067358F|nr:amidohydrolase [Lewinella sp. W8]MTB50293.1 amidohydrolase [Lewinella sp. W8]
MKDLTVSLLQSKLVWHDPAANRARFDALIGRIAVPTDLIILPEMFTTGFTMDAAANAEPMDGPSMQWMREKAGETRAVVTGSLIISENGKYFNRLVWMTPSGAYQTYDKRHLFAMAGEHEHYEMGQKRLTVELSGWKICPLICYDLRFPVWARNTDAYDLLIYTANWPDRRAYDWRTLLRARAIENQCYVVGVNRVGEDDSGHHYRGDSCIVDPGWRHVLFQAAEEEVVHTQTLSAAHLQDVRAKLPFLIDRDDFTIS